MRSLIGVFGKSQGDYKPVLKQLADMGYTSVEAASYKDGMLYGQTPEQFRKDVEDAGMRVISTHCTLNLSDEEVRYIDDGIKPGDGLLVAGGARMPITNELPKGRIYDLLTTKPSEVNALGGGGRSAR